MGIEDMANQAKDLAGQHADKIEQGLDAAAEQVKKIVPDVHDDKVDQSRGGRQEPARWWRSARPFEQTPPLVRNTSGPTGVDRITGGVSTRGAAATPAWAPSRRAGS